MRLGKGSPASWTINTAQLPAGTFIMFALKYPSGTTFSITANGWVSSYTITQVSSFAEVLAGDGTKYYFDGSHLYVKLVNKQVTSDFAWQRAGIKVYTQDVGYTYTFAANCPPATLSGGFCAVSHSFPTLWN